MRINVKGGTNARNRIVKAQAVDWSCPTCVRANRYYWTRCPDCKTPRPS